ALAQEFNVGERVEFVVGDFTEVQTPDADIVVMDRVICCYPEWRALLDKASDSCTGALIMTYPRESNVMRGVHALMDVWWIIVRSKFRFYVHPIAEMRALL